MTARRLASALVAWTVASTAGAADLHVMISGGLSAAYAEVVPAYERASGHRVVTVRGPSMGETPEAIPNRLARGEAADVLVMVDDALDGLVEQGAAVRGSRVDIARSRIAMAVRFGAGKPDIGSVDALRRALMDAQSIAVSDSASGVYLSQTLFPRFDENGAIRAKTRMIPAEPVGRVVARGDAEIGFQQLSELKPVKGIDIVGMIPDEVQKTTVFVAGVATGARQPEAARDFIRFLASRDAQAAIIKSGMEPVSATMTREPGNAAMVNEPAAGTLVREPVPAGK